MMEWIIPRASSSAADVDFLIELILYIVGFWFILAEGVLIYFIIKYRRKNNPKAEYITGEKHEEMKWIHIPHNLILLFDVIIIIFAIKVWYGIKQYQPPADETVRVIGQQWSWTFVHPGLDRVLDTADDVTTVDEFHVKKDTTYHFQLTSTDVLHSFSIPAFRLKQDAVPGRTITGWFKPTRLGKYNFQCAEICGIGHGIMQSDVYVETPEEHEAWLKQHTPPELIRAAAKAAEPKPTVTQAVAKPPVAPAPEAAPEPTATQPVVEPPVAPAPQPAAVPN